MESSQSSSCVVDALQMESPTCWCGLKAPLKASHTSKHPGRKFYACSKYNMGEAKYQFFIWADILQRVERKFAQQRMQFEKGRTIYCCASMKSRKRKIN
ncbi:hypothetical protein I3842_11G062900 [Carya illinoinensis]|uniref:GRF-type domain-containing protein n=1 Tax=Carya illinoinensis TaxID=32201 RepID=A0A922DN28_CARIL|nr:hypothetical protein I3842_11G062900 [Carya illinoinensis]